MNDGVYSGGVQIYRLCMLISVVRCSNRHSE